MAEVTEPKLKSGNNGSVMPPTVQAKALDRRRCCCLLFSIIIIIVILACSIWLTHPRDKIVVNEAKVTGLDFTTNNMVRYNIVVKFTVLSNPKFQMVGFYYDYDKVERQSFLEAYKMFVACVPEGYKIGTVVYVTYMIRFIMKDLVPVDTSTWFDCQIEVPLSFDGTSWTTAAAFDFEPVECDISS